ncbi:Daunorubicin resistance ATP-binding protein drrA, putative [Entamoeba dispar SAW760]|uniref:Daunorubicin resistance ATP-binding protein drrA, putative n=1 Tax=Entamoeba dispar (strain ATCC PRA-260 / SAW760) TaxID=370354 RepID=B0ERX7_ENTDS|nr:Daunorubicin resistance ATP-binding protein drrA, putative [Entamoeba dispar SAW760]EDR22772.1 Daunorubicin resistance ATP-binding protein drrA, putative [Entamoeba dispar SAW760]|eukprot:EDR22772.1 Daunorubicin resistance ATP-binding protein drrA, putative [Entamoeba dispar SAW760]
MRRRLSIAIAMTGNPKVIFLDEPTTGLDVAIRRDVWDLILKIQKNRCIIITTHSMEEADVLCDRVGIMSDGDLIALGTCQRIRNHYAPGYYIKIASEERVQVINFLKQLLGEDVEVKEERGILTAMIPIDKKRLSNIFSEILEHKEALKIEDWEIQQKGLEDAFIEIIEADRSSKSLM